MKNASTGLIKLNVLEQQNVVGGVGECVCEKSICTISYLVLIEQCVAKCCNNVFSNYKWEGENYDCPGEDLFFVGEGPLILNNKREQGGFVVSRSTVDLHALVKFKRTG